MNKIFIVLILLVVVGLGVLFTRQPQDPASSDLPSTAPTAQTKEGKGPDEKSTAGSVTYDSRPASQVYASADEAFDAIIAGAKDYDDLILERFTQPGPDCTWCDDLYAKVTEKLLAADSTEDEKAYLGELLAISGRVENVQTLIQAVQDAGETDNADIFAESLELTIGGDDVVELLKQYLQSPNELLQESVVAAVTNQGSKLAAETLYQHTIEKADPDGYYSLGIGLGEFIPDEEALPFLSELVKKRDEYSHLAVKSLLNQGADGLKYVLEELSTSPNPDGDRKMLQDAVDHITYDDETMGLLKRCRDSNSSALAKEFCGQTLTELEQEEADLQKLDETEEDEKE
jgi:hypothetical protein